MTIEETKEMYGYNAKDLCLHICGICTSNDWYCPSWCDDCEWVLKNYEKAISRLAKLDGDLYTFCQRIHTWK